MHLMRIVASMHVLAPSVQAAFLQELGQYSSTLLIWYICIYIYHYFIFIFCEL